MKILFDYMLEKEEELNLEFMLMVNWVNILIGNIGDLNCNIVIVNGNNISD